MSHSLPLSLSISSAYNHVDLFACACVSTVAFLRVLLLFVTFFFLILHTYFHCIFWQLIDFSHN